MTQTLTRPRIGARRSVCGRRSGFQARQGATPVARGPRRRCLGFFDNMGDRPIRIGEWKTYEITGEVAADAQTIEVGVTSSGTAEVVVDAVTFEKLPALPPEAAAAREAIRRNYARVDSAYAEGDLDAIASLALPDAQVAIHGARTRLSAILTQIMEQIRAGGFRSRSTLTAFRLDGPEATAWVNNESTGGVSGVLSANRDVWVKTAAGWRLKQSALIATQTLTPPEVLSEIRQRSGFPDWKEARIILVRRPRSAGDSGFHPSNGRYRLAAGGANGSRVSAGEGAGRGWTGGAGVPVERFRARSPR